VARLPIEDRDRRRRLAKLQLDDRESVQRGIRDLDALPRQQLANLGETKAVAEPALDRRALLDTPRPAVAAWPPAGGMQCEEHLPDRIVADRRRHGDAGGCGGLQIPADGFRVEPELSGDALLWQARTA
jgi:hypothetical protein